jgi:hypothetical protein
MLYESHSSILQTRFPPFFKNFPPKDKDERTIFVI